MKKAPNKKSPGTNEEPGTLVMKKCRTKKTAIQPMTTRRACCHNFA